MSCDKGFVINVSGHKYRVVCERAVFRKTSGFEMNLLVRIFADGKKTELKEIDGYAREKISDYIENTINGQDTFHWDPDGTNRHLDKVRMPTQKSKDRPSFSEYMEKFYSKHSLSTDNDKKKQRVIVSAGRGIF